MRLLPLVLLAAAPGCLFPIQHDEDSFDVTDAIARIEVYTPTGDVAVRGADVDAVHVEADLRWSRDPPEIDWDVEGDVLTIDVTCDRPSWFCAVDLVIDVPLAVSADVTTTTGDVSVRDVAGAVEATTTTGDVTLTDLAEDATVEVTTGQVVGRDLAGDAIEVQVTTGDIDLVHEGGFDRILAASTTGDIRILVPGGTYDCTAENTTGTIEMTGLVDDPGAASEITATTTTGNIEIIGYTVAP